MALLNVGEDPWLLEYESCEKLHRDIMEQLTIRGGLSRNTDKFLNLSATIRLRLRQYNNEVSQLSQKLEIATNSGFITAAESERRTRQLEQLHSRGIQARKIFENDTTAKAREERSQLMEDANRSVWNDGAEYGARPDASHYSVDQLQQDQRRMIGEQDRGLENLSQIISRQKNIAGTISDEIDLHNEILDDLGDRVARTDTRVRTETQHVTVIDRKDKTCIYWVVIILLFISIIIMAAL